MYQPADLVVYRMQKYSPHPGPRATEISPAPKGESYAYMVDKFWIVAEVRGDNKLLLKMRRGKEHLVDADDPRLRRARWWEKLIYRNKFPQLVAEQPEDAAS